MNHILAWICPPLAVIFAGRLITGLIMFPFWLLVTFFTLIGHFIFVFMAWRIMEQTSSKRQHKELMRALNPKN